MAETADVQTSKAQVDEPTLLSMLLKDGAVVLVGLSIWAAADMWYETTGLWIAQVVAVADAGECSLWLCGICHLPGIQHC